MSEGTITNTAALHQPTLAGAEKSERPARRLPPIQIASTAATEATSTTAASPGFHDVARDRVTWIAKRTPSQGQVRVRTSSVAE